MGKTTINNIEVELIGHDSFKLSLPTGKVVYFDPYANPDKNYEQTASYVFVSHEHFDHCVPELIAKISNDETIVVAPKGKCEQALSTINAKKYFVKEGEKLEFDDLIVEVVPAYNIDKPYHPKGLGVGYVVDINGTKFYHPGDTDFIPEMQSLEGKIDVFFVPISGVYVMDEEQALKAISAIKPKIVIPMHYNYLDGLEKDPEAFKQKVENYINGIEVIILY